MPNEKVYTYHYELVKPSESAPNSVFHKFSCTTDTIHSARETFSLHVLFNHGVSEQGVRVSKITILDIQSKLTS